MARSLAAVVVVPLVFAGLVTACSSGSADDGQAGPDVESAESPSDETEPTDVDWEQVVPGGDCQCSDGSEYSFFVRDADPTKVVFHLDGGGACWSAETCDPASERYDPTVGDDEDPILRPGLFNLDADTNPLADFSFVVVPYCTGDVHLGDTTTEYTPDLTIHHNGLTNGTAALDYLADTFPDATEVVVTGESAGALAAPVYAGLVADRFPDARVTMLADSGGMFPDTPVVNDMLTETWNATAAVADWPEAAEVASDGLSVPGLYVLAAQHAPGVTFARYDYADDEIQRTYLDLVGHPTDDPLGLLDGNEAQIEAAGVDVATWVSPGEKHTILSDEPFFDLEVDGRRFVDWVAELVAGEPVPDVHCTDCT
jgi:hypothetical protein